MKACISRKFFCLLLAVVMVCTLLPITALAAEPSGSIESAAITHAGGYLKNAVSVELKDVTFTESVAVKLYSGETLLTKATLNTDKLGAGSYPSLTCCIATQTADEFWPLTPWTPKDDVVPDKAVLVVDGSKLAEKTFTLNAEDWANLPGTVLPSSGSIESAVITHDNGVLKNAVSVELKNVNFESSVQVQLYRGETLLTKATLNTDKLGAGSYPYLTCCIATQTADEFWSLTPWTPKDDVVPDKAVLVVDGRKLHEKTFTLNAEDWANLPGTAFPYSGSIESAVITHDNGVLKNAVSVELKNVNFESSVQVQLYRGETLLTKATLNTDKLGAGSYPYLTCCIATQTADEYWSLTPWTPKDDVVPDKAVLVVDGHELDTKTFTLNAEDWANLPGTAFPYSGSIESAVITHDNGVLKNAVSVELKNVNFESSVQVQLYRGETLLTKATLNTDKLGAGSYPYLTCCIATQTADEYWSLTPWTPKDDVVPNKAVLVVDGHELDTKTFTLNAKDWANLPGTAFPYSGSIESAVITHDNGVLKNAVSVELKNVNFESSVQVQLYRGETLLTTATLNTDKLGAGPYPYLTCCIATETADEYWSLTSWTPKDDVVPNKAVLVVDGHELDTKTFTLDAEDWTNLPGTVPPSYTVTYTDGVEDEVVFADQSYTVKYNEATPAFQGDLTKYPGWKFKAWTPDLADTVTEDVTYTATWEPKGANTIIYWGNGGTRSKYSVGDTFWSEYTSAAEIKVRGNGFLSFALDEYAFNGWNTKADGTGDSYKSGDMYKFTAAHDLDKANLYAQWVHVACDKHLEDIKVITEPTCTEDGLKLCRCTVCGKEMEVEIPALGHDHRGNWTWNREEHWKKCLRCGAIIDCEEHTYGDWKPVVDNKGKDTDREERSCTVCGFTQYAQTIHIGGSTVTKPTDEQNPNTGAQVPSLLPALAVLAGAAVVLRKRK